MQATAKKAALTKSSLQKSVCDETAARLANEESTYRKSERNRETPKRQAKINFLQFPSLFPMDEFENENNNDCINREKHAEYQERNAGNPKISNSPGQMKLPLASAAQEKNCSSDRSANSVGSIIGSIAEPQSAPNHKPAANRVAPVQSVGVRKYASLATFVEGYSNRLAKTAAQIAVMHPGKMNPIYIHSGTSLGKTHLLEGIYSEFKRQKGNKPALYMTAEQFTSSFIESLRQGTASFRNKFHGISALLIDDITFLLGKNSTQTELLHLIESLKKQGVQLVFTGDRPLKDFDGFRSEFVARLEAGMVCEIQPPEQEILLTIFRRMVEQRQVPISDDVCQFVVSRLNSHARQLSGALNRLHATFLATNQPITLSAAQEILNDLIRNNRKTVRLVDIEKTVCETFGIHDKSLQSKSRTRQIAHPRMLAMWLARKYTRSALSEIGQYFGGRTHSTVVSAQKKIDAWIDEKAQIDCFDQSCPISEVIQKVERVLQAG